MQARRQITSLCSKELSGFVQRKLGMSSGVTELGVSREAEVLPELIFNWDAGVLGYHRRLVWGLPVIVLFFFSNSDQMF
jgi:hypothetical protein